jgi:hypothetical protein
MLDVRAALATGAFAFSPLPPNRPSRSNRRTDGARGAFRLIRAFRRELADAAEEPSTSWLPRLEHYPY